MNVLAIDPGGTTGLATWRGGGFKSWQRPFDEALAMCHQIIALEGAVDLVVCEGIAITAATLRKTRNVQDAIEYIGVVRYLSKCYGKEFVIQMPADKGFGTDSKLRHVGWWNGTTGGHANDAARHLLKLLADRREGPVLELLRGLPVLE